MEHYKIRYAHLECLNRAVWFLITALAVSPVFAQDFVYPRDGICPATHMMFHEVCLNSKMLREQETSDVARRLTEFKAQNQPRPGSKGSTRACLTKIDEDEGEILKLANGAMVEVTSGFLGYVGYRKDAILFKDTLTWKIFIEGKRVFPVEVFREPYSCKEPSEYRIEAAVNDETFIINGEVFKAKTYCLGWNVGESAIFLDGSEHGLCMSASILNIHRAESCDVWCE